MDISTTNLAGREMALNKANVGQEILLKSLEKTAEAKEKHESGNPRPVERAEADRQGRIDLYA